LYKKITKGENPESDNVRSPLPDSGEHFLLDSGHFGQIRLASDHGRILASFGRNLVSHHPAMVAGLLFHVKFA
jgi:hypothetical protein